nr:MAG: wsv343-like protein [Chiromantes dehaani nimavirus]
MFKADILDMAGGKESNVDVRVALSICAESMSNNPETLTLCASSCDPKYDNRRIPLVIPAGQEDITSFNYFSTRKLMNEKNPLVEQLGHRNVKDAAADGSFNTTNLLYTGSSVVEYDLVEDDIDGKQYMYSEPSVLEEVRAAKNEGRYKVKEVAPVSGNEFLDRLMESSYETINSLIEMEGPYVSSGKLLTDIMVLMRLYEEETRRVESTCVDPAFRKILTGGEEAPPLFNVAFITNAALMGLKVVFYPTALEWKNCVEGTKDCTKLKSLLKIQMSVMGHCIPMIVEKIEEVKTKYTFCFKVDIGGSSNWNLPGHCKRDPLSFPYHFARLIGQDKNMLEISNKKMVTSLGIVDCVHAKEWMYDYLGEFERRSTYAENILGAAATANNGSEWRRKVLFSDIGPELPFRNKSIAMDLDFCLSGMCYRYIASGQGILLSKRRGNSMRTKMFSDDNRTEGKNEDEAKKKKQNTAPPVPTNNVLNNVIAAYDNMIKNDQTMSNVLQTCDKFGMFLDKENVAPGLAMKILSASKNAEKKDCMDSLTNNVVLKLKWLSCSDKLKHNTLVQFALLQLILRYECRYMILPRDGALLRSRMKLRSWSVVDFSNIWKFAHEETLKPPTEESLAGLMPTPPPPDLPEDEQENSAEEEEPQRFDDGIIKKMLLTTASTFASGADKEDTMFFWMMVTLAERFCALYNIVSHPEEYYHRQQGRLSFEGGLCEFKKMCEILLPELEVYVPKNAFKVCREAVRGYEIAVEKNKNVTNNKVCKVKLAELKMIHGLIDSKKTKAINHNEVSTTAVGSKTFEAFQSLFDPLKEESDEWAKKYYSKEEEEEPMDCDEAPDERLQDQVAAMDDGGGGEEEEEYREASDVMADFFNCVNNNRSFIFRASLCHRQKYVSVEVVRALEKELGRLLTLKKHSNSHDQVLKEICERSERMRDWIVPFTMPSNSIDIFSNLDVKLSDHCNCFQVYSGSKQGESCEKCIKLLVIPPSIHLKSLIVALKFNTMASERRYFSDVSAALGFTVSRNKRKSNILSENRWNSFSKYKCGGKFLAKTSTCGLYENVIMADNETVTAFKPRTASRKKSAEIKNKNLNNKHTGFFSGVWALCANHDLETTVLGSTVSSPFSPTPLLKMSGGEIADTEARISLAADAKRFFEHNSLLSFFTCFEQMVECMNRTNLTPGGSSGDDAFFSGLIKKHGQKIPGAKLWILLLTVSECFKNSLPVDWANLITNWTSDVLNLTGGVNNIDESGAVFEISRFLSVCARSFFGSCLNVPLGVEVWEKLLNEQCWVGKLARAYEAAIEDNDVRVAENFINSSNFMTNNNMKDKLKIVPTENDSILHSIWKEEEGVVVVVSLRKRAEWLATTEKGMSGHMSFSFVLAAVSLFRVLLDGEDVKKLAERRHSESAEQQLVPLIRGLKITSRWCKTFIFNNSVDSDVLKCISEMRFVNVQKDPLFFYRFASYTIGLIAANDVVLENITRKILDSFDFNGFDTSNWTRFIRYHFPNILLGRRARLLSRPLAFVKNLVGLAASNKKFAKPTGDASFEKRVCNVASRLAKLILVKTVDSETVSMNDILDCCILEDEDVTVRSISALYSTVRSEFTLEKADYSYILTSNSCTNSQLAKIKSASRLLNCNVSSHDTSTVASAIDADEEAIIDPSRDTVMSAADAEVRKSGGKPDNDGGDSGGNILTAIEKDSSSSSRWGNPSCSGILSFDEETIDEDIEPPELLIAAKSTEIFKKVTKMLMQQDINLNVVQMILKMKTFLTVKTPFNESDYQKLGVRPHVIKAGVEAIRRWEEAVEEESSKIIDECENLQSVGGEYDMSVINPADYAKSKTKNCIYSAEMCEDNDDASSPSFNKALLLTGDDDCGENDNFNWLNFQKTSEKPSSKHDFYNCGGGRLMGYAAKDMVEFTGEGTAEIRVITKLFSNKVNDSYWLDVMPSVFFLDEKNNKKNWHTDKNSQNIDNSILKLKVNGKVKESKSITHCDNLISMYRVTDQTEGIEDDNFITTKSPKDIFVILGENADKQERYKCLRSLWNCNNGISPRNQIELLKKLLFKDTNILWIKQYDRHINVLNNWGCLNVNNVYDLHFSLCHDYTHEEVRDAVPPMSVFHSRFLDDADYEYLSKAINPLFVLKKKLQSSLDDGGGPAPTESSLLSGLYSREILSSCLDPRGKFCTSYITNSSSVLFTPGTNMRLEFDKVSSMDKNNRVYLDEDLAGKEKELNTRSFLAFTLEILEAVERGVFFEGGKANDGKISSLAEGRVLRPVSYSKVKQKENLGRTKKNTLVVFETPETNNVISETNDCILLNCDKAKCLLMSQRAMLNSTTDKRYDGSIFNSYSMRYHAGISKGYLLDDTLDLFSIHERTYAVNRKSECDIDVFTKFANHFILPNSDKKLRILTTDWNIIKSMVQLNYDAEVNSTLIPYNVPVNNRRNTNKKNPLEKVSPYNLHAMNGKTIKYHSACFLANPCGPARRLLQRAPNMRICMTNAGIAQISRRLAQSDRIKNTEGLIRDGSITAFKVTSGSSCISVDSSRYFLIDGTYLLGGRIEDVNLQTDMFTRCKLKAEKHVVCNSLFSSRTVSAFLATVIEGTTHSQGLALLEHVSSMKNNEVANRCNKNFWSFNGIETEDGKLLATGRNKSYHHDATSSAVGGKLKPPSIYTNDEDYIFLKMLYEIAKAADNYNNAKTELIPNNRKSTSVDVTRAALYAIIKCYVDCVDQSTGVPRLHVVYFLRSLLNFGGFCTAICSGDGEKSHHLIYTLNSVALNMAAKAIVVLVGPSGNNLKTTIVEVVKKAWFEKYADVSVGVLNSSKDSTSSTQANLAYFAGNKNILIIDEVGYQGSTKTERDAAACDDTTAVWKQIDSAMTKSKLKICSKECDDIIMSARPDNINKKKRKQSQQNIAVDDDSFVTDSAWLMERTVHVKAFANNVIWWNCMSGTVSHTFNDIRTCFNMLNGDRYPFSVSDYHSSPWLMETDALVRHCAKPSKLYTNCEIKDALHCLVGDYASKTTDNDVARIYNTIIIGDKISDWKLHFKTSKDLDEMSTNSGALGDKIADWKLHRLEGSLKLKAKKVFDDLVKGEALLRWTIMNSVKHADRRPVLTCVPDSEKFKELLVNDNMKDDIMVVKRALGEHRLNPNSYEFENTNNYASDGVLYAFHAVHSGAYSKESPLIRNTEVGCNNDSTDAEVLGPVLSNISCYTIENHRAKSQKLSSIIFNRGDFLEYEVDEDIYINMEQEYDYALFNIMEKPSSKSFPKITTDGALVMSTTNDDCESILHHIKKTIIDPGKFSNTGSLIRLCVEKGLLDDKTTMFDLLLQTSPVENNKTLRPKCRKMLTSLIKFKSDGRTLAINDIANMVSSKSDDANSAITKHMLPGQFNSNMLKKITTKQASAAVRGIFCKPVVSSISMTPIMTSNSYVFSFFVDEALAKRMVIFPCNTQFAFGSVNENVETFIDLVDSGLKCVHSALTLERQGRWKRAGIVPPEKEVEKNMAIANNWVSIWNESVQRGMRVEEEYVSDPSSVAAMLPARALQLLVKNSVLEHRDVTSMAKLEESANTFMHMYTTFTLASKTETANDDEKSSDDEEQERATNKRQKVNGRKESVKKTNNKPLQMCQVNPKSLNTMVMAITKSRQEAWAKINMAMNCVLFVETPFVRTSRLFGEDCNLKMFVPKKEGVNPNINLDWCIGLRMPNPDMNVTGYNKEGPMIGAGAAIMKQVCDAWGSTDLRTIMYSCYHLHMLFELVFQFTQPKRKLPSVNIIRQKNKAGVDYVSVIFACLIYKEMVSKLKYPVFVDNGTNKKTKDRGKIDGADGSSLPSPFEIPMFVSMLINKPLAALRFTTNFGSLSKLGAKQHTELIKHITGQLGQTLNVDYLCPTCKR